MASAIKEKILSVTSSSTSPPPDNTDQNANYRLHITAGPNYDKSLQRLLTPNSPSAHKVSDQISLSVRIKSYTGLPSSAPISSPYFDQSTRKGTFSIAFCIIPGRDICTNDLYFGIDTGHNPIRKFGIPKSLVNTAFKIVKEFIGTSLSCDAGADEPWLRGPLVAGATTTVMFGEGGEDVHLNGETEKNPSVVSTASTSSRRGSSPLQTEDLTGEEFPSPALLVEGGVSDSARQYRKSIGVPADAGKRKKFFNNEANRKATVLQKGRRYYFDFSNGYIDWKAYALKLPGFSVPVLKYLGAGTPPSLPADGQGEGGGVKLDGHKSKSHKVRFFLKDIVTGEVLFVIMCTLLTGEELGLALKEDEEMHRNMNGNA